MPTLRDLLDILLVTVLIYQLLLLIRGTRAVQLVMGLVVLFVLYALSRLLGLVTVNWLLSYVGIVIPIAFLILFQPALRRLLGQLARRWGGRGPSGWSATWPGRRASSRSARRAPSSSWSATRD